MIEMNQMFDFYNGGGLNICFLGMGMAGPDGSVNVHKLGKKLTGPGGFIDISQSTKRINFMSTFTVKDLEVAVVDGKLKIVTEGKVKKFVKSIGEATALEEGLTAGRGSHEMERLWKPVVASCKECHAVYRDLPGR